MVSTGLADGVVERQGVAPSRLGWVPESINRPHCRSRCQALAPMPGPGLRSQSFKGDEC